MIATPERSRSRRSSSHTTAAVRSGVWRGLTRHRAAAILARSRMWVSMMRSQAACSLSWASTRASSSEAWNGLTT